MRQASALDQRTARRRSAAIKKRKTRGVAMLDQETTTTIMKAVDAGFDDQIELTAELVRFPSLRGAEHTAQDFLAAEMRRRGLAVDRFLVKVEDIQNLPGFSPVHVNYDNAFNVVGCH